MEIEVTVMGKKKKIALNENATGEDLLNALNLLPDGVLIINENNPIPYTEKLKNGDKLRVIRVASGG
ncbi:MAG: MoaD/ThiS family protein [Thermoplasmata archaeon]|nr:MAG: MoaD/ThiS family protein [Thermoplasmata archaeon]